VYQFPNWTTIQLFLSNKASVLGSQNRLIKVVMLFYCLACALIIVPRLSSCQDEAESPPRVSLVLILHNLPHLLPYALTCISNQTFPKDRISLTILRTGQRQSKKVDSILEIWLEKHEKSYESVSVKNAFEDSVKLSKNERMSRIAALKEDALEEARSSGKDFILYTDTNFFITDHVAISHLISLEHVVAAPVLKSVNYLHSTFWSKIGTDMKQEIRDDHETIVKRWQRDCFEVPLVQHCFLIDLTKSPSKKLSFLSQQVDGRDVPDDKHAFAVSAQRNHVDLHACNYRLYGFLVLPGPQNTSLQAFRDLELNMLAHVGPVSVDKGLETFLPPPLEDNSLHCDQVYLINLKRRPDRRRTMDACLERLGVRYKYVEGIDGVELNEVRSSACFFTKPRSLLSIFLFL
jgi:hypothetical protein